MRLLVSVDEEQRVAAVQLAGSSRTLWDVALLAVPGVQEAVLGHRVRTGTRWSLLSFGSLLALDAQVTCGRRTGILLSTFIC